MLVYYLENRYKNGQCLFCQNKINIDKAFCYIHDSIKCFWFYRNDNDREWVFSFKTISLMVNSDMCLVIDRVSLKEVPIKLESLPEFEVIEDLLLDHYEKYAILT